MTIQADIPVRIIIAVQLITIATLRSYFGAPRAKRSAVTGTAQRSEPAWLTTILAMMAVLHFGAVLAYLISPSFLQGSAFGSATVTRWIGIAVSCLGIAGEVWAAVALGASYSPRLQVSDERVVVTAGPYRWIRHPLYAFWLPTAVGWGLATHNWFILFSGAVLIFVLALVRVPREEAMMLAGFGEQYGQYMQRTGRFIPRLRTARPSLANP